MYAYCNLELAPRLFEAAPWVDWVDNPADGRVEAIICNNSDVNLLASGIPRLRWVQIANAGYDNVDLAMLRARGIVLCNAKDVFSVPIAEDVLLKMLMLERRVRDYERQQRQVYWERYFDGTYELSGRTIGIVGTGSIGQALARLLTGFSMRVLGYRRHAAALSGFDAIYTGQEGLLRMLPQCDYVVLTLPSNPQTGRLFGRACFDAMKPSALFFNVGRGDTVDEEELVAALAQGRIRGAGLDVFEQEPLPAQSSLWQMEQVIVTPHQAGSGDGVEGRKLRLFCENLHRAQQGAPLLNQVIG